MNKTLIKTVTGILKHRDKYIKFIEDNNFDHSDWYNNVKELAEQITTADLFENLKKDMVRLCEDNEEMKDAIKEYFGDKEE